MSTPQLHVDFIARLADAWDGRGEHVFRPYAEHLALLDIAGLASTLHRTSWANLDGTDRLQLIRSARRVIELGRQCAWIFGEGPGARF